MDLDITEEDSHENLRAMSDDMVAQALRTRRLNNIDADFFVLAVMYGTDKRVSYWGVLDFKTMPEEDLYVEAYRRFHAAMHEIEEPVHGYGIVEVGMVLNRTPIGGFQPMP